MNELLIACLLYSIIVTMFFLGGKWSPLWASKWYRKFYKSIGLQINQAHRNGELGLIYKGKRKETVCLIVNGDWNIQKSGLGEDY